MEGRLVRFLNASPTVMKTVKRGAAFSPIRDYLRDLTFSGAWPLNKDELALPATVLEGVFCEAQLLDAA
ncbi:hypothetical protein [Sabulicella glaciei]|nr:hypothetical protein [Roseococcus sp. MDT2-1-1]